MKYYKEVKLKNNETCILKTAEISMAEKLLECRRIISGETNNVTRYPHEVTDTVDDVKEQINRLNNSDNEMIICACIGDEVVASAGFSPISNFEKLKHRAYFGISVKKEYWGIGIGYELTKAIIETCKNANYKQLELEVVCSNTSAINLYKKLGFTTFGTNEKAFLLKNGEYLGFYLMCLDLGNTNV